MCRLTYSPEQGIQVSDVSRETLVSSGRHRANEGLPTVEASIDILARVFDRPRSIPSTDRRAGMFHVKHRRKAKVERGKGKDSRSTQPGPTQDLNALDERYWTVSPTGAHCMFHVKHRQVRA